MRVRARATIAVRHANVGPRVSLNSLERATLHADEADGSTVITETNCESQRLRFRVYFGSSSGTSRPWTATMSADPVKGLGTNAIRPRNDSEPDMVSL